MLVWSGSWKHQRLFWNHNPCSEIRNDAELAKERTDQPDNPNQRNIEIKIFGEPQTHAGHLALVARAHEAFVVGATAIGAMALALATGLMLALRR